MVLSVNLALRSKPSLWLLLAKCARQRIVHICFSTLFLSVFLTYLTTLGSKLAFADGYTFQVASPSLSNGRNFLFKVYTKPSLKSKEKHWLSDVSFTMLFITSYIIPVWGKDYSAFTDNPLRSLLYQMRAAQGYTNLITLVSIIISQKKTTKWH